MPIAVELSPVYGLQKTAMPGELIEKTGKAFDAAMDVIHDAADKVATTIKSIDARPDDVEVSFSIKATGEASAVIAKTSLEGTISVKLTWKKNG